MILIGIAGAKGSGKNTFAQLCIDYLRQAHGREAFEMSWAELLKVSAAESLGLSFDSIDGYLEWADKFKEEGSVTTEWWNPTKIKNGIEQYIGSQSIVQISGREFLQNYGTEAHREIFDDDFWVNAFWTTNDFREDDIVFICDTRFENEARSIKEHNGLIIQIANDKVDSAANDTHASEVPLAGEYIDIIVDNNGSLEDLKKSAEMFVEGCLLYQDGFDQLEEDISNESRDR